MAGFRPVTQCLLIGTELDPSRWPYITLISCGKFALGGVPIGADRNPQMVGYFNDSMVLLPIGPRVPFFGTDSQQRPVSILQGPYHVDCLMSDDLKQSLDSDPVLLREPFVPPARPDRRRRERPAHVSKSLIPLLRFRPSPEQVETEQDGPAASEDAEEDDNLQVARGIAFGLAVSGIFWVAVWALLVRFW